MSIADSLYNKIGFYDITETNLKPVVTPQNSIVVFHLALLYFGLNDPQTRLLIITFFYYIFYLGFVYVIYKIFDKFKVSSEITLLSIGILLLSAYLLKIMLIPINDGIYCLVTAAIFYIIITLDTTSGINFNKLLIVTVLGIIAANSRLNGPLIFLSASLSYLLLKNLRRALLFLLLFCCCYCSVFLINYLAKFDFQGLARTNSHLLHKYTVDFFVDKVINTITRTIPGLWGGWTGRQLYSMVPFSISIITFYFLYFRQSIREKDFAKIFTITVIAMNLIFLQIIPGYEPRYITIVLPLTLLAIATYFKNDIILSRCFTIILIVTVASSVFRLVYWEKIFFGNYETKKYITENITEPYLLMSQSPRDAYYVFNKRCSREANNSSGLKTAILFGSNEYLTAKIDSLQKKHSIKTIEYLDKAIVFGHEEGYVYHIVRIILY